MIVDRLRAIAVRQDRRVLAAEYRTPSLILDAGRIARQCRLFSGIPESRVVRV